MAYIFVTTKEKTNWKYILIIVILALIVVGESLLLLKQEVSAPLPKSIPSKQTQDETANWNTYRNEEYGFEVKYPKNWQTVFITPESLGFEKYMIGFRPIKPEPASESYFYIGIGIKDNPQLLTPQKFYNQERKKWEGDYSWSYLFFNELKPISINIVGREAFKFEKAPGVIPITFIVVSRDNLIFEISKNEDLSYTDIYSSEELKSIFDQMLSTFRFLE